MKKILKNWLLPFLLTLLFVLGRVKCYGPMNDSVAAEDTESYYQTAAAFPSPDFFRQPRSATIPLILKLTNPSLSHQLTLISEPFFNSEPELVIQPGTESWVKFQTILSIGCWVIFTLLLCGKLAHPLSKAVCALLIYGFAFVPQTADWDSVLLSESVSFSFFVLMNGFLISILPFGRKRVSGKWAAVGSILLLLSAACWIFTRDTNVYYVLCLAAVLLAAGTAGLIRRQKENICPAVVSLLLIALSVFEQQTFKNSERWVLPMANNLAANVFPYPERTAFFQAHGMPVSDDLLKTSGSAEYNNIYQNQEFMAWLRKDGLKTYKAFLLDMPLWSVLQVYDNLDLFFKENTQPFFYGKPDEKPLWAVKIGNLLHSISPSVILMDLLLTLILLGAVCHGSGTSTNWLIFCALLLIGSGLMTAAACLGEVRSIWRHVQCGVLPLRLLPWILIPLLLDLSLSRKEVPGSAAAGESRPRAEFEEKSPEK